VALFAAGLSNHALWTPDEPRVAEIGREMALSGNWAVPTLNGKPFLEKPPLYFWALASTFRGLGGASHRVARIPSALFGLGGVVAVFFLARMLFGLRAGFFSALILATTFDYLKVSHRVLVDSALACFVISAMACFMRGYLSGKTRPKFLYYGMFYLFCGLAFLSKGLVGFVIPGLAVLSFLVFERNLKEIGRMAPWLGAGIVAALCLPWLLALWQQGGWEYLEVFVVKNHIQRFLSGGSLGHHKPFYYYLGHFPGSFLPWSLLLVPVAYRSVFGREDLAPRPRQGVLFMKCWFVSGFVLLSIASTKRTIYLLPLLAPGSVMTAWWIDLTLESEGLGRVEGIFVWFFGFLLLVAGLVLGALDLYLSRQWGGVKVAHWLLTIGLSLGALRFLRRKRLGPFWVASYGTVFSLFLFLLLWIPPSMDRYKSFVPFCRQVAGVLEPSSGLYGFRPDETLRGVVPFYTGRFVKEIDTRESLEQALDRKDRVFVVVMDGRGQAEKEVLATGKAYLLVRRKVDARYICSLLTNRAGEVAE